MIRVNFESPGMPGLIVGAIVLALTLQIPMFVGAQTLDDAVVATQSATTFRQSSNAPEPTSGQTANNSTGPVFNVKALLSNGTITEFEVDNDTTTLIVWVQMNGDGRLQVTLPRGLIDSRANGQDINYAIVNNEVEDVSYEEIATTNSERTLKIPLPNYAVEVAIQGTQVTYPATVVPEFPVASLLMLGISIIVVLGRKLSRIKE